MVVGFTATYPISCEFESRSWRGIPDTTLCDKVRQSLVAERLFSLGTQVSSTNKTDCHDIAEILLKVELNTITLIKHFQLQSPTRSLIKHSSVHVYLDLLPLCKHLFTEIFAGNQYFKIQ